MPSTDRLDLIERIGRAVDAIEVLAVVGIDHAALGPVGDEVAVTSATPSARPDAHVADHMALLGARKLRVCLLLRQPHHALAQAHVIVGDVEQGRRRVGSSRAGRRHHVGGALGEQREPFLDLPFVEQIGLEIEEILIGCAAPRCLCSLVDGWLTCRSRDSMARASAPEAAHLLLVVVHRGPCAACPWRCRSSRPRAGWRSRAGTTPAPRRRRAWRSRPGRGTRGS